MRESEFETGDRLRVLFAEKVGGYRNVTRGDIEMLACMLGEEHCRRNRYLLHAPDDVRGVPMHVCRRKVKPSPDGGIESAFITVWAHYFDGREGISFNRDGRIGFAGWADSNNVKPMHRAFERWVTEWMEAPDA